MGNTESSRGEAQFIISELCRRVLCILISLLYIIIPDTLHIGIRQDRQSRIAKHAA